MNYKIIFIPICWFTQLLYSIRYVVPISGHSFREFASYDYLVWNGNKAIKKEKVILKCEICGYISK